MKVKVKMNAAIDIYEFFPEMEDLILSGIAIASLASIAVLSWMFISYVVKKICGND